MSWWIIAAGATALMCAAGHAVAGWRMFYRPMRQAITNALQGGVLAGMWHLITIHFTLCGVALFVLGARDGGNAVAWLVAGQFTGYAALYFVISLRLGGATKLFQWMPFAATAILATIAATR